uniref:xanthine dehydrogenase n=1 Tax=Lygus hesperus TaxID=30085 RepID=A0A0A9WB52_LYGHE
MIPLESTSTLVFFVNGKKVVDNEVNPEWTLLHYLRNILRLCGTKLGCAEGGCGACTVMVSKLDRSTNQINHIAVNACLTPVAAVHGQAVTTVEGIGSVKGKLHPVQERIAKAHGSQCGFCTPGIVMSMYTLLRSLPGKPTMSDMEIAFQGNLCRCTGYRPIIEGFKTFTEEWEMQQRLNGTANGNNVCGMGDQCCRNQKVNNGDHTNGLNGDSTNGLNGNHNKGLNGDVNGCSHSEEEILFEAKKFKLYDPTQELIFPPELRLKDVHDNEYLLIKGERTSWHRPKTLDQILELKKHFPSAKIINGNTEVGVEVKFKNCHYPVLIQPSNIKEMTNISSDDEGVNVGAAVTLSNMEKYLKQEINTQPGHKTAIFQAAVDMLHWFAGKQIRNVGTLGGNIMTGSPISDMNPILMAAGVILKVQSKDSGSRRIKMDHTFWTGYRRNVVKPDEILISVSIPYTKEGQIFKAYKQAKRRDDDIAIVNAAYNFQLNKNVIEKAHLAYGGMAPTTVLAVNTAKTLIGKKWDKSMIEEAYSSLVDELPLDPSAPGGTIEYRRSLTLSLFFKFYLEVVQILEKEGCTETQIEKSYRTGKDQFHYTPPKSSQYFTVVPNTQEKTDAVGRPIVHASAFKQATGEAVYCDDIPRFENEAYLSLVLSKKSHAKILSIDASAALEIPGVYGFFSAKDISKEHNKWGPIFQDEELFASEKVVSQGQIIGAVAAVDQNTAQKANRLIKVEYEDIEPAVITIEDAIRHSSYINPTPKQIKSGDVEAVFSSCDPSCIVEGDVKIGGQEHFYLETHAAIAIPSKEDNEIQIISSTQHPSEIQHLASHLLGIPNNLVTCKTKRLGGGFGGKESRGSLVALPVALAAHKLGRPVRMMLDRDEDMMVTGQRHPFYGKYKAAFTPEGKLLALQVDLYANAGYSMDLTTSVLDRAMFHVTNACHIPNLTVRGFMCRTNTVSNTAFRGFGGPQGMFVAETIIDHVAVNLKKSPEEIRALNLFEEGNTLHYNQTLGYCTLGRCWEECMRQANYVAKKKEIELFNKENRWRKRGISVVPTMFGIAFTSLFLNQAGALVLVYRDGSVLISHGGTEMGQGLHTKMIQVASRALGIPADLIHISETSTDKVPNTSPTAASAGSDLNGMAIIDACNLINERLKPIKEANPKGTWEEWVNSAYFSRVSLAASGFYKTPDIGYNMQTNSGMAFNYHTYGAACSEVEIDCLTGDHQVLSTNIVMDLGESLNPAIDIGQIEGGFMQGYGLFSLEEMIYSPTGTLYSRGPGAYKIPGFADIPLEFNVALLKGAPNPRAVYSSKAVGEPPLFLAASIFFAIKEAVKAARADSGKKEWFRFDSPATSARIRMACSDEITQRFPKPAEGSYKPWNVPL